ncbi:MAG: diaminopimelate decarboxylase [Candidatus Promineifilaceae bacterium]|nr:diaminopimelate decarboxylase [Candidatus Promineifilaceae bacterium]
MQAISDHLFLSPEQARAVRAQFGTPVYIYHFSTLLAQAQQALEMPNAYGLTVRYAIKANPNKAFLQLFDRLGLHFDASSGYEVYRALRAGVAPEKIQLTAQELPEDLPELVEQGVLFNAGSLSQLQRFGALFPGREVSIRVNPGRGSGHSRRTNVGGPLSPFGIWHEHLDSARAIAAAYRLRITRLHSHVGSGADPDVWRQCAALTVALAHDLPAVRRVNLGGGFKVARMPGEPGTDLPEVGAAIARVLRDFREADAARRDLHLEIEPGAFLVANAGALLCTVIDVKDTGRQGERFTVLDGGMNDLLRPTLYGAQHPIWIISGDGAERAANDFIVVGHCCESGDIFTPAPGKPEEIQPRRLPAPQIGDIAIVGGAGAYGAAMGAANYNSFPRSAELLLTPDGELHVVRRRQALEEVVAGEQPLAEIDGWETAGL